MVDFTKMTPHEIRNLIRKEKFNKQTSGISLGYAQANLVILPKEDAFEFLLFAQRNPKPCPILDITDPGNPEPKYAAPGADIRTDIPNYRIYRDGTLVDEVRNINNYWGKDLVGFLLGCSFTFESALMHAGIPVRNIEEKHNVPMYITNIRCNPAGRFNGPLVVSMRPIPPYQVVKAIQVTSRFPGVHGAPIHLGDPSKIGIKDINRPDFGDPSTIKTGEVPVFWACGVTPQAVVLEASLRFMITHSPGHMFITDISEESLSIF